MTVLVMSATGTTGRATVAALLQHGANVRAASRTPHEAGFAASVEAVRLDLDDNTSWAPALRGVDALYLCVPSDHLADLRPVLAFVALAVDLGVRRIVTLSGMRATEGDAPQQRLEAAVEASGARWVHLRPNFFLENFLTGVSPEGVIALPAGAGCISFVAAKDIGAAAAVALLGEQDAEVWTLTGPEAVGHDAVAAALSEATDRTIRYEDVAAEAFRAGMRQHSGLAEAVIDYLSFVYSVEVRGGVYAGVSDDFLRCVGRPPTPLKAWAEAHSEAFAGVAGEESRV